MNRKVAVSTLVTFMTLGLVVGFLADAPPGAVPPALAAACQNNNAACAGSTTTSSLDVDHAKQGPASMIPVEPDSGESWSITAYWNTAGAGDCYERSEVATVDVDWTGTGWSLSNESTTTNIHDIDICDKDTCQDRDVHSSGYELIVDIEDPVWVGFDRYNLRYVKYDVSDVDDGYELDNVNCTLGSSVTWDNSVDGGSDSGPFNLSRCAFSCDVTGGQVTLLYE